VERHGLPRGDVLTDRRVRAHTGHPGRERLAGHRDFIRADVTSPPSGLKPGLPPLVADEGRAAAIRPPGNGIEGRTAGPQGMSQGWTAIVLEKS
jgi:hypothetical protein